MSSATQFYPLTVKEVRIETADCVSVSLEVPRSLERLFRFSPGQYVTLKASIGELEMRRSYSICCSPKEGELRVAVKKVSGGKFSSYINSQLKAGDILEVMPPMGRFTPKISDGGYSKNYLAFAAGSGITPVMSIMKSILEANLTSTFTLIYGNKNRNSIIFREAIEGLKNKYMHRLRVYHVLSQETMDVPLFSGRVTAAKTLAFCKGLISLSQIDEAFICGPEMMIIEIRQQLIKEGLAEEKIRIELFSSPDQPSTTHKRWVALHAADEQSVCKVSVRLDGVTFDMDLPFNTDSILDAALKNGADLPYACKGGVCSTCRAKVVEGAVAMEVNYALEKDELEKGFVLTCQAHPTTKRVIIDFDAR